VWFLRQAVCFPLAGGDNVMWTCLEPASCRPLGLGPPDWARLFHSHPRAGPPAGHLHHTCLHTFPGVGQAWVTFWARPARWIQAGITDPPGRRATGDIPKLRRAGGRLGRGRAWTRYDMAGWPFRRGRQRGRTGMTNARPDLTAWAERSKQAASDVAWTCGMLATW